MPPRRRHVDLAKLPLPRSSPSNQAPCALSRYLPSDMPPVTSELPVDGASVTTFDRFGDSRGYFNELYNEQKYDESLQKDWKQVSFSSSQKHAMRGLHCSPHGKFITCVRGAFYDVIACVDTHVPGPLYCTYWVRVPVSCGLYVLQAQGSLPGVGVYCTHAVRACRTYTACCGTHRSSPTSARTRPPSAAGAACC